MNINLQPNITGTNVNLTKGATQADLTNSVNNSKTYRDEAEAFSIVSEAKSVEASYSALNASISSTNASDKATIATTKANEASNSANSASASETVCIAKATIATDNANIAIAQATIATNKATEANTSANTANTQANIAITKASEASISASNALTSENNADTSEANALIYRNQAESFANSINPSDLVHISGTETITGNKTFSGTVSGLTKATVGLSNVDNTSDANKPISNAVQTALGLKADKATTLGGYGITDAYTKTSTDSLIDIHSKTAKTTLVDADEFMTADSTSTFSLKKITWANIKNTLASLFISKVTSTDNAIVRFNGVTGEVQNSGVVIDDNNNVGIGVTPSAWTTFKALEIGTGNGHSLYGSGGIGGETHLGTNVYYNSGYKYTHNDYACDYKQNAGQHIWYTAPSGTAGNAITWTNAMTLDTNALNIGVAGNQAFVAFFTGNSSTWSGTQSATYIAKHSTSTRSINAAGTINASGADYAEYEYSNDITLAKGQIVGFKADGTLTDKYSEAIRFAIKSTNPSIVGGDTWGIEEIVGKRPERPVKSEEMTDEEFTELEELYELELADFEARLEVERQKVDRIAYAGKVPVNVYGAIAGQYVIAIEKDGGIDGKLVNKADMTFAEYQDAVGRVNKILDDGRAEVAVIIH